MECMVESERKVCKGNSRENWKRKKKERNSRGKKWEKNGIIKMMDMVKLND